MTFAKSPDFLTAWLICVGNLYRFGTNFKHTLRFWIIMLLWKSRNQYNTISL